LFLPPACPALFLLRPAVFHLGSFFEEFFRVLFALLLAELFQFVASSFLFSLYLSPLFEDLFLLAPDLSLAKAFLTLLPCL